MSYVELPEDFEFSKEYDTWIIAYCPDNNEWFTTKQRAFFYEYPKEFNNEEDAISYFSTHIEEFLDIQEPMCFWTKTDLFLLSSKGIEKYN